MTGFPTSPSPSAREELDRLEREASTTGAIPFRARASALDVLVDTASGRWKRLSRLPFRR